MSPGYVWFVAVFVKLFLAAFLLTIMASPYVLFTSQAVISSLEFSFLGFCSSLTGLNRSCASHRRGLLNVTADSLSNALGNITVFTLGNAE